MSPPTPNTEFVTDLMDFSRCGPLAQVFILDAIGKHAGRIASARPQDVDHPLIAGAAWIAAAREIRDRIDEAYGAPVPAAGPPVKAMLFAALLAADEIVVNGYDADKVRLAPSGPDPQPYMTTASAEVIFVNDQEIELTDEGDGSEGTFVYVRGESHRLVLQRLVRRPMRVL